MAPPKKTIVTPEADATIHRMRAQGTTWAKIAAAIGCSQFMAIQRGKQIGAYTERAAPPPPPEMIEHNAREPLPAGHPLSWTAITAGTTLEGARYPHPVRLHLEQARISPNSQAGLSIRGINA